MCESVILGIIGTLGGAVVGAMLTWHFTRSTQRELVRGSATRDELTKALGPLYSIVHQPEISIKQGIKINEREKRRLDRIVATYPHLLPAKVPLQWRLWMKESKPSLSEYTIPVNFRKMVVEEFCRKLEEYFKATGQSERLTEIDEYRKPWE
jgi:hypothetical protein